jgi:iron uptake system component EfeO
MPIPARAGQLLACSIAAGLALTACASTKKDEPTKAGSTSVLVKLTNDGCKADPSTIPAGGVTFKISNEGGSAVSEAELVNGSKILGEKEGLTPGLSGSFSLNLVAGDYEMYCPHAKTERSPFTVTAASIPSSTASAGEASASLKAATTGYHAYVLEQSKTLVKLTGEFVKAVKAGDIKTAKSLYADSRAPYEAVEPVAESFGDLDPDIDARENDVPKADWRGFHRIEKALWISNSTSGMATVADRLLADVKTLVNKIERTSFQPAQLANGATELLNEVSKSKLTGEEERYSHTDLTDIDANVTGSKTAFELLQPALRLIDAPLATAIADQFKATEILLRRYELTGGGYLPYGKLTSAQVKELTIAVDALAEPLSKVSEKIVAVK